MNEELKNIEELAAQYGWNAEGEKSAEEYVRVALDKFPDQGKKIKQLSRTVDELTGHLSKVEQITYERARKELEQQRISAIKEGDVEKVVEIDKQQSELQPKAELHPAVRAFEEKHADWINDISFEAMEMQKFVEDYGKVLGNKRLPPEQHMDLLDKYVQQKFPDYFQPTKEDVAVVERGHTEITASGRKKTIAFRDLTAEQQQIAKDFDRAGVMSVEKYIQELIKYGDIK